MNLHNKNIIITGASSGIGKALAKTLASKANTLILIARRKELLEELSVQLKRQNPKLEVLCFANDITDITQQNAILEKIIKHHIEIDVLMNNAGMGDENYFHISKPEKTQQIINLNISSTVSFTHLILNEMMHYPKGKAIVFVGSGAGIAWMPGSAVYSASKHFITSFAMNLKSELKPFEISVYIAALGPVDSEFDKIAGIKGGMKGGPSQNTRISSEVCAIEIVQQLEKDRTLILPGKKIRRLMKLYINLPWFMRTNLLMKSGKQLYQQSLAGI